ncbi:Tyrosinase [Pseudocercospora fuligena]|uniref:tyrosinase n=1 Tax=Pseudocercospora fuligena TaxID=685502 RepID=A0A8H6RFC0_9PEZI|nr:Tyrosinase [Pseudocercospora fuligena]
MKFFTFLSAAAIACTSVLAHPVHPDEQSHVLEKRQQANVALVTPSGSTYPRLEIRQLKDTKPNQWTLLVLAMNQFMTSSGQSSYFAISGIHGVPRVNYNNVGQCSSCGGADGYCAHDSVHFPAWHRAYLAMFEQELLKVAMNIANQYPSSSKASMVAAATQLRLPYWDWAAKPPSGRPVLPLIVTDVQVTVNGPKGSKTITNPFFRYDFKSTERSQMYYGPFTTWTRSYRYPNSNSANAASNTQGAVDAMSQNRQSLQDQIYQLFTNCKTYLYFSNDDAGSSNSGCSNSLEGIHNTIHTLTGGPGTSSVSGGHMTYLPTAAFDPIFWLHHCNVDRIFAMWQALNPNQYGASQVAPHSTWTIAQGSTQNAQSPLTPFKKADGSFWNTNDVRSTTSAFKYTYPEFSNSDGSATAIRGYVNRLYGPSASATAGSSKRDAEPQSSSVTSALASASSAAAQVADILPGNPLAASNGSLYQYVANVQTPRYTLNGTYNVLVFNGKPGSEDPSTWTTDKNLIGTMGVMSQPGKTDHDLICSGSIPLTRTLQNMVGGGSGLLSSLAEIIVAPYLTKNLEWRIAQDGKSIDTGSVDGFVVSVVTSSAQPPSDPNDFPEYSPFIPLVDITKGQSGGANSTQQAVPNA